MGYYAVIGGTGLTKLNGLEIVHKEMVATPFGDASGPVIHGDLNGHRIIFIARHGYKHTIPPHKINYRANIFALKECGADKIIAVNAVGGIAANTPPKMIVIPDQIIDYSHSRLHTFYEDNLDEVVHVDFTNPYSENLRNRIINILQQQNIDHVATGIYGVTQGPRLESAAEIQKLKKDGCTIVGMTGMPEAGLARELELEYVSCSLVANWAAGLTDGEITMDKIQGNLTAGIAQVKTMLENLL